MNTGLIPLLLLSLVCQAGLLKQNAGDGMLLHAELHQNGHDLILKLHDPEGRLRLTLDGSTLRFGQEEAWFTTDQSGDWTWRVTDQRGQPATSAYKLVLAEPRPPRVADR